MAIIACAECGTSVSTAAVTCPHCGAGKKAMIGRGPTIPFGWVWRGLVGAIGLLIIATIWAITNDPTGNAATDPVTAEDHAEGNARLHSAIADVTALRRSLRNPSSLALDRVLTSKIGNVVCIRYRARNGLVV